MTGSKGSIVRSWIRDQWFWLKWALLAIGVMLGYTLIARRLAKRVSQIKEPVTWRPITDHSVAVLNPGTGEFEVVALEDGVDIDDVVAMGITEKGGSYEVQTVHVATDRRGNADRGRDSDLGI